jgi:tetratricopeptide (TPR) repeat protein
MKNNRILVIATGTCLMLATFVGCGGRSGEKEYNKAIEAWQDGDLVRARTHFEKAIRKMSGNEKKSVAENKLGLVLWQLGEVDAAAEAFNESCALSESLTGANLNLGIALYHAERLDEAEVALNNVLGDNPRNETALSMLGLIAAQKRDWAGASKTISRAVAARPSDPAGQNALVLAELNSNRNTDLAVSRLSKLVSAYPDYAPAAYNLAAIYDHWLDNQTAATGWYKEYLRKSGPDGSHGEAARQAIARLGGQTATGPGTAAPQTDPAAAARYMAEGAKRHQEQKYTDAIEQYRKAIGADPTQKNAYYNMGLAYYALKKYSETEQACLRALKVDPGFVDAQYMLALAYVQQGKWNDAEREAKILSGLDSTRGDEMLKYITSARKR